MQTTAMMETYPASINLDRQLLARVVDAAAECAQACTSCADACLSEEMVADLRKCIRTNLDCADICETTARVLSRHTGYDANITRARGARRRSRHRRPRPARSGSGPQRRRP